MHLPNPPGASELRRLRLASILEGITLSTLLFVAVPLKYIGGLDVAVKISGPIHGFSFLLYTWLAVNIISAENGSSKDIAQYIALAVVPLGGFFGAAKIAKKVSMLEKRKTQ